MSGIGPPEPGEGTRAWEAPRKRTAWCTRRRRVVLALAAAAVLLGVGGYLHAGRPQRPPAHTERPRPQLPYPVQVVDVTYLDARTAPASAPPRSFSFAVLVSVASGPPVTVTRVTQPYAGLSLTTEPPAPFRTRADSAHKITITMHVTECRKVPRNAGLPFLDVTLRNTRAIQEQSFILGRRYAQDLSHALEVACSNRFR